MARVAVIYFNSGGGHLASARALFDLVQTQRRGWKIDLVDLDQVLAPADPGLRFTGRRDSDWYNWWLRTGWTFGSPILVPVMHFGIRVLRSTHVALLKSLWRRLQPDLVLSLVPHYNRTLFESLQAEAPRVPFVTLLTDFADYPPHFWIEKQNQHFICATERASEQVRQFAGPDSHTWRVSGMVIHPSFYETRSQERHAERARFGLQPDRLTGIVLFGAHGSRNMLKVGRHVSSANIQLIFMCGHNRRLAERLRATKFPFPIHVEEYTEHIAKFMQLADFFIGKPGSISISEALVMGLPPIVESNWRTLANEKYNGEWLRQKRVGLVDRSVQELDSAIQCLADPQVRTSMRRRALEQNNRAVFEVADILESILDGESVPQALGTADPTIA